MESGSQVLFVIPARGGSKGIPRKNLRTLGGKPLIYYSIRNAFRSAHPGDVYVTSDDDEILLLAERFGAKIHERSAKLAQDETTLDPVVWSALQHARAEEAKEYRIVVTLQPTSPLLTTHSLDAAIAMMLGDPAIDTIISGSEDTHLTWRKEGDEFRPNYLKRVNRQYLPPVYKETGAFLISRAAVVSENSRIGSGVQIYPLTGSESIDIDSHEDWNLCEYYLRKKRVLFVVSGHPEIGLGHVYNTLILANDILDHDVEFLVDHRSALAYEKISALNYNVHRQVHDDIVEDVRSLDPDVVVNDRLDTEASYVKRLKELGCKVINFEDLGEGARHADLVVNAIYPELESIEDHYFGHQYFCLRDEFLEAPEKEIPPAVRQVLVSFGGVDPNNFTRKVLDSISEYCAHEGIRVTVVAGSGYARYDSIADFDAEVVRDTKSISEYMLAADVIFTSAGRTVYEVAATATPALVLAQNDREMTHFFASKEYGFRNLGPGWKLTPEEILIAFREVAESPDLRRSMSERMKRVDLDQGRVRVRNLMRKLIEEES